MDETIAPAAPAARRPLKPQQAEELVIAVITRHADAVLRTARRHSLCADDAQDAYQRALEILLRHAHRLDPERAGSWLHTVVKHEAMALRRSRSRLVGMEEMDLDALEANTTSSPEERVLQFEHTMRSAEALKRLKPQEIRALWLKAAGHSYRDICEVTGWTYTKVNRCLTEGRRSFLERYEGIETGEECLRWEPVLSALIDGEATGDQLVELRPHLRNCGTCRATLRALRTTGSSIGALFPPAALTLGTTELEHAGSLLARLYETVSMTLHERAASTVLRAQAVIETATAHKAATLAASAVAVAGGGLAVDEATRVRERVASSSTAAAAEGSAPRRQVVIEPTVRRAGDAADRTIRVTRVTEPRRRRQRAADRSRATKRMAAREPLIEPLEAAAAPYEAKASVRAAGTPSRPSTSNSRTPDRMATSEFGFEGR